MVPSKRHVSLSYLTALLIDYSCDVKVQVCVQRLNNFEWATVSPTSTSVINASSVLSVKNNELPS